jgi:hypothetical protein
VGVALLALPGRADAEQKCPPGQTITSATADRCCWPGQTWSEQAGACTGPRAPAGVRMSFAPAREGQCVRVTAMTPSGPRTCTAPCSLSLAPGPASVYVSGTDVFARTLLVPSSPATVTVRPGRGLLASRLLIPAGTVSAGLGFGFYAKRGGGIRLVGLGAAPLPGRGAAAGLLFQF